MIRRLDHWEEDQKKKSPSSFSLEKEESEHL
jgi:hypothetical protein